MYQRGKPRCSIETSRPRPGRIARFRISGGNPAAQLKLCVIYFLSYLPFHLYQRGKPRCSIETWFF